MIREELVNPKIQYFLAQIDDTYVGYAKLEERPPAPCVKKTHSIYLGRLYLVKGAQGAGLGSRLLEEVYAEARLRQAQWIWLSVWENNYGALDFYIKRGFTRVGEWDWPFESLGKRYVDLDYIMIGQIPKA